jgi:hypothetical protein
MATLHSILAMPGFTTLGQEAGQPLWSLLPAYKSFSSPPNSSIIRGPRSYPGVPKETRRFLPFTANRYAR